MRRDGRATQFPFNPPSEWPSQPEPQQVVPDTKAQIMVAEVAADLVAKAKLVPGIAFVARWVMSTDSSTKWLRKYVQNSQQQRFPSK